MLPIPPSKFRKLCRKIIPKSANHSKQHVYPLFYSDSQFNESVEHYVKNGDAEIQHLVEDCERDFETSLQGKLPEVKVVVPPSVTKERLV